MTNEAVCKTARVSAGTPPRPAPAGKDTKIGAKILFFGEIGGIGGIGEIGKIGKIVNPKSSIINHQSAQPGLHSASPHPSGSRMLLNAPNSAAKADSMALRRSMLCSKSERTWRLSDLNW